MDFLRSQLAIVQDRLAGLTASQRMLAGALVVILVMTMLYWGKISSSSDRVSLLNAPIPAAEMTQLTEALKARGIDVTVDGGKVMVPSGQAVDALGEISFNGLVPAGTTNALDVMLEKSNPWSTSSQFDARLTSARQQYLAQIFRKWPGVKSVDVYMNDAKKMSLTQRDPSMTVNIESKRGESINRKQVANNARQFAQRCMSGLKPENIAIAIDGATMVAGGDDGAGMASSDALDLQRAAESDLLAKLREACSYIPGVLISVAVDVDSASVQERQHTVDAKNKYSDLEESETKTQKPVGPGAQPLEPGVMANIPIDAASPSVPSGPSGIETEELKLKNRVDYGTKDTTTTRGPGKYAVAGATISVPRSYLMAVWRQQKRVTDPAKEPSDDEIESIATATTKRVRAGIVAVTGIKDESRITVSDIWDLEPIVGGPLLAAATPGLGGDLTSMATSHAKEVVLAILAVASLFMVSRMVKKSEPISLNLPALAGAGGLALAGIGGDGIATVGGEAIATKRRPSSIGGEDIAGEVGGDGGGAVMMGQELDPEVLETSQIIEQVSSFVKQNPDAAAQMVSRWMSRD